ncbi:MAG TPA: hypothetical protein VMB73_01420 [Acetobacteraceae bacterium]|nr:hypothetical protein [Acetobacteraceae bacterium]
MATDTHSLWRQRIGATRTVTVDCAAVSACAAALSGRARAAEHARLSAGIRQWKQEMM